MLKVMKTRDLFMVEAHIWFRIDDQITCDETYIFPEDQLLIQSRYD